MGSTSTGGLDTVFRIRFLSVLDFNEDALAIQNVANCPEGEDGQCVAGQGEVYAKMIFESEEDVFFQNLWYGEKTFKQDINEERVTAEMDEGNWPDFDIEDIEDKVKTSEEEYTIAARDEGEWGWPDGFDTGAMEGECVAKGEDSCP